MAKYLYFWICSCAIVLFSCGDNSNEANAQYEKARKLFENGQYANAKNAIDSIELLYPKAFKQEAPEPIARLTDDRSRPRWSLAARNSK